MQAEGERSASQGRGVLVLVVGPSGAGKDTLIAGAQLELAGDQRFHFARRMITRAEDQTSGERHEAISEEAFVEQQESGAFLLSWRAHGNGYAIPAAAGNRLEQGQIVIANVSRSVIEAAQQSRPGVIVVVVTAPAAVLADRLEARGRETRAQIDQRLSREVALPKSGARIVEIINDRAPEHGINRLVDVLKALAEGR